MALTDPKNLKSMNPIIQQYTDMKAKHPEAIVLFRCGDFYETYKDDAEEVTKILGITLTKSTKLKEENGSGLRMAGFPYHALDSYIPKLVRAGKRVAICDMIETVKPTAKRQITEIINHKK